MKKFITLCGFLVLGSIACGDADVVKAEAINEQTTDTSGYTITIPSDVDIDKDSGKGSFAVSGKAEAQVDLNVSVSSKNNYKLKNKSQEISYSLDKESFHIDNKQSASSKSFDENFTATASDVNTNFSGNYKDNLVFDITGNKTEYYLDLNGWLDEASAPNIDGYGTVDIYIEGKIVASGVSDFYRKYPYGTNYEIKNIKATTGHVYNGTFSGCLKGRITEPSTTLYPSFSAKTYTLTVNPNGGLINGDGSSKVLDTKLRFDTGNCWDISYLKPTREGFEFLGWYDAPENGNIVYDSNGKCINNGNYWKDSSYVNPNNLTVYAHWNLVYSTYEIAYDLQGGSVDSQINNPNNYKIVDDGDYFIGLKSDSDRIVSASNGGKKIRDTLEITAKDSPSNEAIFTFERYKDTPYYYIFNKGSGKAINISGDGDYCKEYDSPLELWYQYDVVTKEDAQDFLWFLEEDDNNCIKIVNKSTNKVWSLKDNDDAIGTILYQRNDAEENGQKFVLKEISISSGYPSRIIGPDFDTEVFINYRIPIKVGYKFEGWKIGDKIYQPGSKVIYTPGNAKSVTAIAQWEKVYSAGTVLNIEGTEYTVIEQKGNSKVLLVANKSPYSLNYQAGPRSDGKNWNTYEGSQIDNYLENEWYGSLSPKMKEAIQSTDIKQSSYSKEKDTSSKQEVGPNGQVYNTISRHVFIPSISEIEKIVNLENTDKLAQFLNNENIWTRDSCQNDGFGAMYLNKYYGMIRYDVMHDRMARPAFVIDLSKVNYTVTGTVNYK